MKKKLFLITVLSIILSSCKQNDLKAIYDWENYQQIIGTPLNSDSIFLGRPGSLVYFNGWLGLYDFYDDKILTWINLQTKVSKHNTTFGNGPGEFTPPLYLYKSKDPEIIKIFERSKGIFHTYQWLDVLNGNFLTPLCRDSIGSPGNNIIPCGDNYAGNRMLDDKQMFFLVSPNKKMQIRFGSYPGSLRGIDDASVLDMITQCLVSANMEGTILVAAGYMSDMLSFYKIENSAVSLLKEYFSKDADVNVIKDANGISIIPTNNTLETYVQLYPTKSYLYALYWGTKENERVERSYIQVFDWKGNFIKGYYLKDRLNSIAIDENTEKLYGLSMKEENPCILVYPI